MITETIAAAGIVSPMLASAEPKARFMLVCNLLARDARNAASPSGNNTRAAITIPITLVGAPTPSARRSTVGVSTFANPTIPNS